MNTFERLRVRRLRLPDYYRQYHEPLFLHHRRPATRRRYRESMSLWAGMTRSPHLNQIGNRELLAFQQALSDPPVIQSGKPRAESRGLQDGRRTSKPLRPATVNTHLVQVQAILNAAGPSGLHPGALDVLSRVPHVKPLPAPEELPRYVEPEVVDRIYAAATAARHPKLDGVEPAIWWRALIAVAVSTGFRRGELLALRWTDVNWQLQTIRLPAAAHKKGRGQERVLHPQVLDHLSAIRSADRLIFPWRLSSTSLDHQWHRIQLAAGLDGEILGWTDRGQPHWVGLHDLRRTFSNLLEDAGASVAELTQAMGHRSFQTTVRGYLNRTAPYRRHVQGMELPFRTRLPEPDGSGTLRFPGSA